MMLLMLVCSVTAAGGYYMVKATEKGTSSKSLFVIFTLASPFVLLLALSVITTLQKVMRKLKRRKKTRVGDSPWDKP